MGDAYIDSGTGLNKITNKFRDHNCRGRERETGHYKIKHPNIIGLDRTQHKQTKQKQNKIKHTPPQNTLTKLKCEETNKQRKKPKPIPVYVIKLFKVEQFSRVKNENTHKYPPKQKETKTKQTKTKTKQKQNTNKQTNNKTSKTKQKRTNKNKKHTFWATRVSNLTKVKFPNSQ